MKLFSAAREELQCLKSEPHAAHGWRYRTGKHAKGSTAAFCGGVAVPSPRYPSTFFVEAKSYTPSSAQTPKLPSFSR